ncbi:MAG TPA: sialidase family protein [Candidatus Angelobacter sp.]|nr:sialidase family protein [Candidatus Angelobacter sp.]
MKISALLFALCSVGLLAQKLPPAPRSHLTEITPKPGYFNEPAIAVNPGNPQQLVAAWQVPASVAYSKDGGQTWKVAEGTAPKNYRVSGDVSLAYDAAGHAILCYIAFDKLGTTNYWAQGATRNGIFIRRSLDGGQTWEPEAITIISHESTPEIPFEDKPWVVADTAGPHAGNLYIGWTQFTLGASDLLFSRSTDEGKTWSGPVKLSSVSGLPRDDNGALEGFHGVVGPDGTLYTIWDDRDGIMMAVSHDGGATFSKERRIIPAGPGYFGITGVSRSNGFPQIGMDTSTTDRKSSSHGKKGGSLYVAWSDYSNGDVDVFASSSADHGHTWSAPVRVNSDPIHNGHDQFFQWMAVDPQSGAVNLIFYDRRTDNEKTTVTLARSTDGGKTFQNYTWDPNGFAAEGDFLGDYLAITTFGNKVYGAWAHQTTEEAKTQHGKQTRTTLRIGSANFN